VEGDSGKASLCTGWYSLIIRRECNGESANLFLFFTIQISPSQGIYVYSQVCRIYFQSRETTKFALSYPSIIIESSSLVRKQLYAALSLGYTMSKSLDSQHTRTTDTAFHTVPPTIPDPIHYSVPAPLTRCCEYLANEPNLHWA
jgi:hypothetical protein